MSEIVVHGGKRANAGAKPRYGKLKCKYISILVPEHLEGEVRHIVGDYLEQFKVKRT